MRNLDHPQEHRRPEHESVVSTLPRPRSSARLCLVDQPAKTSDTRDPSSQPAHPETGHPRPHRWAVMLAFAILILCGVAWASYTVRHYADLTPGTQQGDLH